MKILVTGNCGYIGPVLGRHLAAHLPQARLYGLDTGFFLDCCVESESDTSPWYQQYFGDIRELDVHLLKGIDAVVHLAAISNDPMGDRYQAITEEINQKASIQLAHAAKQMGVKRFVFASSCSIYGCASDGARCEQDPINPLTAYARSKVAMEQALAELSDNKFTAVALRFSTACGASPRLRLDLVLNDFVYTAHTRKHIQILSDGTPWRPLIDVQDMSRAIEWAITTELTQPWLAINVGSNNRNYQVATLAQCVSEVFGDLPVSINSDASPDKRSYQVNFSLFESLAPMHQPRVPLAQSISEVSGLLNRFSSDALPSLKTKLTRLHTLESLQKAQLLNDTLHWVQQPQCSVARQR